jgi:hypothetical protein
LCRKPETNLKTSPWFLNAVEHPPTDPLTKQLLALVEGLESVPGPKTIGSENYAKVSNAFFDCGWAGFEEAFDEINPRTRPDYASIKRELLRESIFDPKVHLRMSRVLLGEITIKEALEEAAHDEVRPKTQ